MKGKAKQILTVSAACLLVATVAKAEAANLKALGAGGDGKTDEGCDEGSVT
jgi:hypothetical protein